jgi:hypothetical protein
MYSSQFRTLSELQDFLDRLNARQSQDVPSRSEGQVHQSEAQTQTASQERAPQGSLQAEEQTEPQNVPSRSEDQVHQSEAQTQTAPQPQNVATIATLQESEPQSSAQGGDEVTDKPIVATFSKQTLQVALEASAEFDKNPNWAMEKGAKCLEICRTNLFIRFHFQMKYLVNHPPKR